MEAERVRVFLINMGGGIMGGGEIKPILCYYGTKNRLISSGSA